MKRSGLTATAVLVGMLNWSAAGEDDRRVPADVLARRQCFQTGLRKSLACEENGFLILFFILFPSINPNRYLLICLLRTVDVQSTSCIATLAHS